MLLKAQQLEKYFGDRRLFTIDQLEIMDHDRIGLVGPNGVGKSTLLNILAGKLEADTGWIDRRTVVALVSQNAETDGVASARYLSALCLTGSQVKSGGERTRLAIASALSQESPLLLADEPTTNLDVEGIELIEKLFSRYAGALVLVSHDRMLLDGLCTKIWALENETLRTFKGNYSDWLAQREREREFAQFEYEQYVTEKRRLEKAMAQTEQKAQGMLKPPSRMGSSEWMLYKHTATVQQGHVQGRAKAFEKRLDQLEVKERPERLPQITMPLGAVTPITAKVAVTVHDLTVQFGTKTVLDKVCCTLPTAARTVLLGANGAGKTTLVAQLCRDLPAIRRANGLKIGYFAQQQELLDPEKSVLLNAQTESSLPEHQIRAILANLYLGSAAIGKKVSQLSGGERAKVAFARLLASDCNLLILDEPTNHLDLYAAEALERLLLSWRGTLLVITHDRRLTEKIAQRLWLLENGGIKTFEGSWAEYGQSHQRESAEDLDQTMLSMRMAALCSRLASPQKGDDLAALEAQWQALLVAQKKIK